jgi:hypothetical protein
MRIRIGTRLMFGAVVGAILLTANACQQGSETAAATFTIAPDTASLLVGQSVQLTAVNSPTAVSWASDNAAVASVIPQTGFVQAIGRGNAAITASTRNASALAHIHVTVPPAIGLSKPTVAFDVTVGDPNPTPQTVAVTNAGDGTLGNLVVGAIAYGQGETTGWLTVSSSGSSAPLTVTFTAKAQGLARGTYTAIVPVTAPGIDNSPQNVAVTLRVLAPASIVLSRSTITLAGIPKSTAQDSILITNGGDRPLSGLATAISYTGAAQNWLVTTLDSTTAPTTLRVVANTAALDTGAYAATVHVNTTLAGVGSKDLAVTLAVGPGPSISFSRPTVTVAAINGQNPAAQTVNVTNGGGGTLSGLAVGAIEYGAGQPTGWLAAALDKTAAPAVVTLTLATATLSTGSYSASVPVSSPVASNSPASITVSLSVGPPPAIALNPTSVTFGGWTGGTTPGPQPVQITNSGGSTLSGLSISISYGAGASGWLSGTFQSGTTTAPTTLLLQPTTTTLSRGTYTATVTVASSIVGVAAKTASVSYTIQSFSVDVYPLFSSSGGAGTSTPCTSCHAGLQAPNLSGSSSTVYNTVHGLVTPGNPSPTASLLVCKITGGASCPSAMLMPGAWVSTISSWIKANAPP